MVMSEVDHPVVVMIRDLEPRPRLLLLRLIAAATAGLLIRLKSQWGLRIVAMRVSCFCRPRHHRLVVAHQQLAAHRQHRTGMIEVVIAVLRVVLGDTSWKRDFRGRK